MFKIWARTMSGDKIIKSRVFPFDGAYKRADFYAYLTHICEAIDIPVPVVLKKHTLHFEKFNNSRFLPSDFVEAVDFSAFIIENTPSADKKPKNLDLYI
ncbi:MAG: hypothetical protein FWE84_05775 [Firmicutes bacterium]|nr:hypothetical protein [Bacillota bacterium]